MQGIFAGKAHPCDHDGKLLIKRILQLKEVLKDHVRIAFVEDYDLALGKLITAGVDLWLNTPQPPLEASGTSGMKAALNGIPSLSILDGWWIEGLIEGVTGWAISDQKCGQDDANSTSGDAASLYDKLQREIMPLYWLGDITGSTSSIGPSVGGIHRHQRLGGLLNYYGLSSSVIVPAMPSLRRVLLALFGISGEHHALEHVD